MKKEALMETPLSREDIFHGRIFDVHKDRVALPDGRESTREVVHHKTGGVCVVPLTEDGKDRCRERFSGGRCFAV